MYKVERCLLLDILQSRNMTQKELADKLNLPKQRIYEFVHNRTVMSYPTAFNIAEILECDMRDLYKMSTASKE